MASNPRSALNLISAWLTSARVHVVLLVILLAGLRAWAQAVGSFDSTSDRQVETIVPNGDVGSQPLAPRAEVVVQPLDIKKAFHVREDVSSLIRQVLGAYNISASVDDARMPAGLVRFDTDEVDYGKAAALLRLATNTIFIPLDAHRVMVLLDTQENRAQWEPQAEQTLYLPGLTSQELTDVVNFARLLFDVRAASAQPAQGTVTLVGPSSRLQILDATVAETWRGNAQIAVDLQLTEIDRSVSRNVGLKLPQSSNAFNVDSEVNSLINANSSAVSAIVSSGLASADDTVAIAAILIEEGYGSGILADPFAVFGNGLTLTGVTFGTLTADLSLSSTDSRSLKHSQTVVREGETAQLKVGSRYPLKTSEYKVTNYTTSGQASASTTTPQIQYEDLGITAKVTPFLQEGNRIKIKLDLSVQGLAGNTINGLPVLTNRKMVTEFSVSEGGTAMAASVLDRQETRALTGLPGFDTTTNADGDHEATEIVLTVTPRLVYRSRYESQSVVRMFPPHD